MSGKETAERRRRSIVAAIVVAASVAVFAVVGGTGLAGRSIGAGQYQYGGLGQYQYGTHGKVVVCHKNHHAIVISANAWPAHRRHGDTIGACPGANTKKPKHQGDQSESNNKGEGHGENENDD
jgi:hypothetical protein